MYETYEILNIATSRTSKLCNGINALHKLAMVDGHDALPGNAYLLPMIDCLAASKEAFQIDDSD